MALIITGNEGSTSNFEKLLEAFDGNKRVVVKTSQEAIEDFGIHAVHLKATEKYEAGILDDHGRISVLTTDF